MNCTVLAAFMPRSPNSAVAFHTSVPPIVTPSKSFPDEKVKFRTLFFGKLKGLLDFGKVFD